MYCYRATYTVLVPIWHFRGKDECETTGHERKALSHLFVAPNESMIEAFLRDDHKTRDLQDLKIEKTDENVTVIEAKTTYYR